MSEDNIRDNLLQLVADVYDEAKHMGKDGDYLKAVCDVTSAFTLKELITPTIKDIYKSWKSK